MYYLRARYYDPKVGRFTSYDIQEGDIINPLDMNRYVYCRNNPIKYVDPSGEDYAAAWGSAMWWLVGADGPMPIGDLVYAAIVIGGVVMDYGMYLAKGKPKDPTPPSKLKDGDKVKTPDSHKDEWTPNKDGSYTHNKTGWTARRAKGGGRHGGDHWDLSPGRGSGHINVGPDGNIF